MQVILLEDVPKLGHKYEVKQVAAGYGRNWLLPQNLAVLATAGNLKQYEKRQAEYEAARQAKTEQLNQLVSQLSSITVTLAAKANDQGQLFAGIHKEDIIQALMDQWKLNIDSEVLVLDQPIKTIGEHQVGLKAKPTDQEPAGYLKLSIATA